jgi:hypothetical protein
MPFVLEKVHKLGGGGELLLHVLVEVFPDGLVLLALGLSVGESGLEAVGALDGLGVSLLGVGDCAGEGVDEALEVDHLVSVGEDQVVHSLGDVVESVGSLVLGLPLEGGGGVEVLLDSVDDVEELLDDGLVGVDLGGVGDDLGEELDEDAESVGGLEGSQAVEDGGLDRGLGLEERLGAGDEAGLDDGSDVVEDAVDLLVLSLDGLVLLLLLGPLLLEGSKHGFSGLDLLGLGGELSLPVLEGHLIGLAEAGELLLVGVALGRAIGELAEVGVARVVLVLGDGSRVGLLLFEALRHPTDVGDQLVDGGSRFDLDHDRVDHSFTELGVGDLGY